jgi:copper homeostasis protein CutC
LIQLAGERITILPGGGINASNLADLVQSTCAREFHSGLSSALPHSSCDHEKFESEVRKLAVLLAQQR